MKDIFKVGDKKTFERQVTESDEARFESGQVHPVYSTFSLIRDAEWTCRLFVLDMKDEDEEGIGTFVNAQHVTPALVGSMVRFEAKIEKLEGNEIICSFEARVNNRLVAAGEQGQKIIPKQKFEMLFTSLKAR